MNRTKHLTTYYRPKRFSELKGQDHIKRVLSQCAKQGTIGKAYLFSGTRGVGKTTVARIFAKAINCRQAPTDEPCNRCDICREITNGTSLDVLEIDGASHTGVDNVRKLIEDISLLPVKCKYRVVIIDEVHMLSKSAFNALLKTLEEPPAHVVFILATTEVNKIPSTIISRCQHFIFKKLTTQQLVEHLKDILDREKISYDPEALLLVAQRGEGSVRDSMSILSQLVAVSRGKISADLVRELLGIAPSQAKIEILESILKKDIRSIVLQIRSLLDQGIDISFFLQEVITLFRDLFLLKTTGINFTDALESHTEIDKMKDLAKNFSLAQIHAAWQLLLDGRINLNKIQEPALFLELLFVNLAYLTELTPISDVDFDNVNFKAESHRSDGVDKNIPKQDISQKGKPLDVSSRLPQTPKTWKGFIEFLKNKDSDRKLPHMQAVSGIIKENKLIINCTAYWLDRLKSSPGVYQFFKDLVFEYFGNIEILFKEKKIHSKNSLLEKVKNEPVIQKILDEFKGTIIDVKLKEKQQDQEEI